MARSEGFEIQKKRKHSRRRSMHSKMHIIFKNTHTNILTVFEDIQLHALT